MDTLVTHAMIQYLLKNGYRNKKVLAVQYCIPYRSLLKVCGPNADRKTSIKVARCIVHGCIAHRIPIEKAIVLS